LFSRRIIDGLTGGNISTVFSYVADITPPHKRGKYYGLLGAAGGFGFMIGPALGGFLSTISLSTSLFVAAGVTFVNMLWGYFILTESHAKEHRTEHFDLAQLNPFSQFKLVFSMNILKKIFFSGFLYFLAINAMYGNNSVFLKDVFKWNPITIGLLLFMVGIIDIVTQGFIVRKLLPKIGEAKLATLGILLTATGFAIASVSAIFVFLPI
jgi:MFS transporter, DHA1 family, tetracycline resistance protein